MATFFCIPQSWLPFQDPVPSAAEREAQLKLLIERVESMQDQPPQPTARERHPGRLLWYLVCSGNNVDAAYQKWLAWVTWKRGLRPTDLASDDGDDDIETERSAQVAHWNGQDSQGRPCLVLTARNHDPINRKGNWKTFRKFMLYTVEEGLALADKNLLEAHRAMVSGTQSSSEENRVAEAQTASLRASGQVCILYDRRGIDDPHMDPDLYQVSRDLTLGMQTHYGDRLGMFYVLHVNWFFWLLYEYVLRPFLDVLGRHMMRVVNKREDLEAGEFFAPGVPQLHDYVPSADREATVDETETAGVPTTLASAGPNTQLMIAAIRDSNPAPTATPTATSETVEAAGETTTIER